MHVNGGAIPLSTTLRANFQGDTEFIVLSDFDGELLSMPSQTRVSYRQRQFPFLR